MSPGAEAGEGGHCWAPAERLDIFIQDLIGGGRVSLFDYFIRLVVNWNRVLGGKLRYGSGISLRRHGRNSSSPPAAHRSWSC